MNIYWFKISNYTFQQVMFIHVELIFYVNCLDYIIIFGTFYNIYFAIHNDYIVTHNIMQSK
jgi:hypothetical protein